MVQTKSMSSPRRMSEIGEESKNRLLDAAEALFLEKGFEATTVVEIGKKAGISHGSIPWHFGNKSGILMAVVRRLFDESGNTSELETGQAGFNAIWLEQTYYDDSPKFQLFGAFFIAELERSEHHRREMTLRHVQHRALLLDWINRSAVADSLTLQLPAHDILEFWIGSNRGILGQKLVLLDEFDLPAARRANGYAIDALLGGSYFRNLDNYL